MTDQQDDLHEQYIKGFPSQEFFNQHVAPHEDFVAMRLDAWQERLSEGGIGGLISHAGDIEEALKSGLIEQVGTTDLAGPMRINEERFRELVDPYEDIRELIDGVLQQSAVADLQDYLIDALEGTFDPADGAHVDIFIDGTFSNEVRRYLAEELGSQDLFPDDVAAEADLCKEFGQWCQDGKLDWQPWYRFVVDGNSIRVEIVPERGQAWVDNEKARKSQNTHVRAVPVNDPWLDDL
ncbi:MAG: hypothetical protein KC877_03740 [Candidatus Kaiserbacteria bacterium]|nr:hypothetical protein [Candidatus Kaiserbacteria bacterium]MCB9816139.1 hypothetical protein [Candidatus Nomurabacteria bacterium]